MVDSAASLVYGLPLNVHDLVRAGKVYDKFIPNALVLDLIIARKERGVVVVKSEQSSQSQSRTGLGDMPIEVLNMIRSELLAAYFDEEESYFVKAHNFFIASYIEWAFEEGYLYLPCPCHSSDEQFEIYEYKMKRIRDPRRWSAEQWKAHESYDCEACSEMEFGESAVWGVEAVKKDKKMAVKQQETKLRRLLSAYGLALPSLDFFRSAQGPYIKTFDLAWTVSLPSFVKFSENLRPISSCETSASVHDNPDHYPSTHTAVTFSPSFFTTTPSDDAKFHKLIRDFDIRVIEIDEKTSTRNTSAEKDEEARAKEREEQRVARWEERKAFEKKMREELLEKKQKAKKGEKANVAGQVQDDDEVLAPAAKPRWLLLHTTPCPGW